MEAGCSSSRNTSPFSGYVLHHWAVKPTPAISCRQRNSVIRSTGVGRNMGIRRGGGEIRRLVLSKEGRAKLNTAPDTEYYAFPRFVKHVDEGFLAELTALYRERIPAGAEVLDLMSSWVSHLPQEVRYKRVVGHGLNAAELARNRRLDDFFVGDLNTQPFARLELGERSFDAVVCAVGVQYLEQAEEVFAEIYRVLRPGGVCIVSFSSRMCLDKAVAAWREGSAFSRTRLVCQYFGAVSGFTEPEVVKKPAQPDLNEAPVDWLLSLLRAVSPPHDAFYAVVAYREFKPMRSKLLADGLES